MGMPDPLEHITTDLLREVGHRMQASMEHYGKTHQVLGPAGQFADIWRKVGPLKRALWDGEQLSREDPRTILMDLIGHCLLSIDMIDRGMSSQGEGIGAMATRQAIPASRTPPGGGRLGVLGVPLSLDDGDGEPRLPF